MADWSSQCLTGSTGYNQKPDLVLVSNSIALHDKVTWLSPKVIRGYSKESFQLASLMGKMMDTKAYLVMVDQPWGRFVLGLSLMNEELWVHFYDHSGGSISPPFNIHTKLDSFLYILNVLVFGIQSCISFDMTIRISPPLINSCRKVTARSHPQPPPLLESQLPLSTDAPLPKSQSLCATDNLQPLPLKSQPDQALLPVFGPVAPTPEPFLSSPEATPSIGTIQVGQVTYDIIKVLFSSTGFLGWGTVCYLIRRDGEFYIIKDHWVQNDLKQNQNILQEINMMKLIQGIDGVPTLVDFWVVEVSPSVPDVMQHYRQEKWWKNMKSTRTHVCLVMKPCACLLMMFKSKREFVSCVRDILKSMSMICNTDTNTYLLLSTVQQEAEKRGVLHRDCSVNNTMIEDTENGSCGCLLDWEFAIQINMQHTYDMGRTVCSLSFLPNAWLMIILQGTLPFLSTNILNQLKDFIRPIESSSTRKSVSTTHINLKSPIMIKHTYADNIESLFYVFIWILILYDGPLGRKCEGTGHENTLLSFWSKEASRNLEIAQSAKFMFLVMKRSKLDIQIAPYFTNLLPLAESWHMLLGEYVHMEAKVPFDRVPKIFDDFLAAMHSKKTSSNGEYHAQNS